MITPEELKSAVNALIVPGVTRSVAMMNLIRNISMNEGKVEISVSSAALSEGSQEWLKQNIVDAASKLDGVREVSVDYAPATPKELNQIGSVIAIMSGKGGVGKSLVASLTAVALRRQGHEVGILDADITGPSIPRMFGLTSRPFGSDTGILPVLSKSGIEIMSINLLLPNEDEAVIWRGPLIGKAITQFWEEVLWGKLDYLIVDLPPGTADAPLTVMQSLPISGIIIVFTPQQLTAMVVRKAVKMARDMSKPILGVIENMSYLYVPEIDKKIELFGASSGGEMARSADAPFLGQIPIDPELASLCDQGNIERYDSEAYASYAKNLVDAISKQTAGRAR